MVPFSRNALIFAAFAMLSGQQSVPPDELRMGSSPYIPPPQYTLKAETRLVEVGVIVRDAHGRSIGGLQKNDFEIEDGGKKREISAFAVASVPRTQPAAISAAGQPASNAPASSSKAPSRFLALVFDDLSMTAGELIPARKAAHKFVSEGLSSGDLAGVFFLSRGQVLPFTADVGKLNDAVESLKPATRIPVLPTCPNLTAYDAYIISEHQDSTLLPVKSAEAMQCGFCQRRDPSCPSKVQSLADGIWRENRFLSFNILRSIQAIVDYMGQLQGKRILLMASSGFLSGTLEMEREQIVDHALRRDVVINSLDAKGLYTLDLGVTTSGMTPRSAIARLNQGTRAQWDSNDTMAILAASTGGLFFHDNNDLELGFRELGLAPEFSYSLGFTPPGAPDNKYHSLKVRLKQNRHEAVQARPGYFSAPVPTAPPAPERRIDKEVTSASVIEDLPVRISAMPAKSADGAAALHIVLHVDISKLPFANQAGVRAQKLTAILALFDNADTFVAGKECTMEFQLKESSFNLLAKGLDAGLTLIAPAGKYRLRSVIEDKNEGKITASSEAVEIPM